MSLQVNYYLFAAQVQAFGYAEVALVIAMAQVREQTAAGTYQFEQTATTGLILLVVSQVLGKLSNAIRQDGDLYFRRTCVLLVAMKTLDRLRLDFFCKWHDVCFLSLKIFAGLHVHSLAL